MKEIKSFWQWFVSQKDVLAYLPSRQTDLYPELINRMHQIHQGLVCDFEFEAVTKVKRMVISANGDKRLFPLVMKVMGEAPKEVLADWQILAFRQPRPGNFSLQFADFRLATDDVMVQVKPIPGKNKVALRLSINHWDNHQVGSAPAVRVLLDNLLGEYAAVFYIDRVEAIPWAQMQTETGWIPAVRLKETVQRLIGKN